MSLQWNDTARPWARPTSSTGPERRYPRVVGLSLAAAFSLGAWAMLLRPLVF